METVAIVISSASLILSVLTHIKVSDCDILGCLKGHIETRTPTHPTALIEKTNLINSPIK
jgi:hypothetical protein